MPISNEIFETIRIQDKVKEVLKARKILLAQGYTLLDPEGRLLKKGDE
tara:strand:- start:898 stop:1041 length:144 start_codon:yes stop_codon:yes gene_type:complete